jgi:hypothetical protein
VAEGFEEEFAGDGSEIEESRERERGAWESDVRDMEDMDEDFKLQNGRCMDVGRETSRKIEMR